MKKKINYYGEIEIRKEPISIFDIHVGGNLDVEGNYYIILLHKETKGIYAIPREEFNTFFDKGRLLEEKEILCINGEKSRGMTAEEEREWNMDFLTLETDLWNNVRYYEFKEGSQYETVDWFTGANHTYICASRTETTVTLETVHEEIDGVHYLNPETYEIKKEITGEYIVLHTYRDAEHRLYAWIK